jgi:23S rRNA (guanine2445-N2)-methyltransferase / 23S rRNA (guanine2069-N7)-methyltransferase
MTQHRNDDPERPFFATAARGTEGVLRDELRELRIPGVKATRGGVHFGGALASAIRVCMYSRVAVRVLWRQQVFEARDPAELYDGVATVEWERVLDGSKTLCVDAMVRDAPSTHSVFVAQRVKDAIVDRLRERQGVRPNVDLRDPDVRVVVHWVRSEVRVLIDVAGASLHARGWRSEAGEAPLRETLAAAMLRLSGWDRRSPLIDPMCGAGTLAIEAAQWARGIAPGLGRARLGLERWSSHDDGERALLRNLREEARQNALPASESPPIIAQDIDERVLAIARSNAVRAGVQVEFARADARRVAPVLGAAWLVTNPPYGERIEGAPGLDLELAQAFRALRGYRVCVLARDRGLPRAMQRRPILEHPLWNGPLECRMCCWQL